MASFEVIVVLDEPGETPPGHSDPRVSLLRTGGCGPAVARNLGIEAARGEIVVFTDDDTVPARGWLEAARTALAAAPEAVGVEGPTVCDGFDPLFEHAVTSELPGGFYTCNVAYRRADLLAVGGFDTAFPRPHCEDIDLGRRMIARGSILFADEMRVEHPPRPLLFRDHVRRARWVESEWRLHRKHPELAHPRLPPRLASLDGIIRRWLRIMRDPSVHRHPRRLTRALALAIGQTAVATLACAIRWRDRYPTPIRTPEREARSSLRDA